MTAEIAYWTLALLMLHPVLFYPVITRMISALSKPGQSTISAESYPGVTILMSVCNEEAVLEQKLRSLLELEYPEGRLKIIVGSDGSTDSTNSILDRYSSTGKIRSLIFSERTGKQQVINRLVSISEGDLIVITDADAIPERRSLFPVVEPFANPSIGLVDSRMEIGSVPGGISHEKMYQDFESWLKLHESRSFGLFMGPSGGFYALRRELYSPVPDGILVDDFYIAMRVMERGHSALMIPHCGIRSLPTSTKREEFRRQVRIGTGNFQNLLIFGRNLLPPWKKLAFTFLSHKVLRWCTPILYLLLLIPGSLLAGHSILYRVLLFLQLIFLLLPALNRLLLRFRIRLGAVHLISHFIMMNFALLAGLFKVLRGTGSGTWEPTKRVG